VAGAPGFGAPFLDVLLRDRREAGRTVQVGDDAGQHSEHAGAVALTDVQGNPINGGATPEKVELRLKTPRFGGVM
jgi:hypothetical protein